MAGTIRPYSKPISDALKSQFVNGVTRRLPQPNIHKTSESIVPFNWLQGRWEAVSNIVFENTWPSTAPIFPIKRAKWEIFK